MKNKTLLKFLFVFLLFSACEVKWDMEISLKKTYREVTIAVLIDQEAQMYAVETGQSSIGGLDAILSNLPDGFGPAFIKKVIIWEFLSEMILKIQMNCYYSLNN